MDITRDGITWTISGTPTSGTFANGDPWVVGPITITAISPIPTAGRNGTQVNPTIGSTQGFDDRITLNTYSEALNVGNDLPLVVATGSSVISSISTVATQTFEQIDTFAVLTVLASEPAANSFRPAYIGGDYVNLHNKSDLDYTKLANKDKTQLSVPSIATSETNFSRFWYEANLNWTGRYMHTPYMGGNNGYGRDMAEMTGIASLQLCLDYTDVQKETLLVSLTQYGIDIKGLLDAGGSWIADGGHNGGRMSPLMIAARALNNSAMLAYLSKTSNKFQELQQTWLVAQSDIDATKIGINSPPNPIQYEQYTLGMPEWSSRHEDDPARDDKDWGGSYRDINGTPIPAVAALASALDMESDINHPPLFGYARRHIYYRESRFTNPIYYNGWDDGFAYGQGDTNEAEPFAFNETPPFIKDFYLAFENQAGSVTRNDITWTFDKEYQVGQFVNGDWYVVAPSGLTITSTTPAYDSVGGHNGTMVNPLRIGTGSPQGWDSKFGSAYYDSAAAETFPLAVSPGDSVCTAVSYTSGDSYSQTWSGRTVSASNTCIKSFEVLTVLASLPAAGTFRPAFSGTVKTLWNVSDIVAGNLITLASTPSAPSDLTYYVRGSERPWLMNIHDFQGRYFHPLDNMLNYHQYIGEFWNELLLLVCSDKRTDELLYNFIQIGIDQYGLLTTGGAGNTSSAMTRIPVIATGHFLGSSAMKNLWLSGSPASDGREGKLFYYANDIQSPYVSATVPANQTWTGKTVFFRKQEGVGEHEHLHPSEWNPTSTGNDGGITEETYRWNQDSHPHVGLILAALRLGLSVEVNHAAYFDYVDRWMNEEYDSLWLPTVNAQSFASGPWASTNTQNGSASWVTEMWGEYRDTGIAPASYPSNAAALFL